MKRNSEPETRSWELKTGRGQSLIEVVVSIALAALLAISLVSTSLITQRTSQSAKNNTEATKLAQEGAEHVRIFRDREGYDGLVAKGNIDNCLMILPNPGTVDLIKCNVDGKGQFINREGTDYYRKISISTDPNNPSPVGTRLIEVKVVWSDRGGQKEVVHKTILSRWVP